MSDVRALPGVELPTEGDHPPEVKVTPLGNITKLDLPADRILEAAKGQLEGLVIMGFDKEGDVYLASSYADGGTVLWLMERLKMRLMEVSDEF